MLCWSSFQKHHRKEIGRQHGNDRVENDGQNQRNKAGQPSVARRTGAGGHSHSIFDIHFVISERSIFGIAFVHAFGCQQSKVCGRQKLAT